VITPQPPVITGDHWYLLNHRLLLVITGDFLNHRLLLVITGGLLGFPGN
jgi:hypothetical protein